MPPPASPAPASRKRPASPSPAGSSTHPNVGPQDSNTGSQDAHSSSQQLKRQRLAGRGRATTLTHANGVPTGSGSRPLPLLEASTVPQPPSGAVPEPNKQSLQRTDKGKGRETSRDSLQRTLRLRPSEAAGNGPVTAAAAAAVPAEADPRLSSSLTAPTPRAQQNVAISAANGHAPTAAAASAPATTEASANEDPAAATEEAGHDQDEEPPESREALLAQIKILQRRLQAQERQNEMHTRALGVLNERCSCDICFDFMTRPCVVAPCGHIACRECLVAYWKQPSPDEGPLREGMSEGERRRVERNRTLSRTKRCPVCRSECSRPPAEAWLVKQMIGDIERWKATEDRHATQETLRRSREDAAEAERQRQERTRREAGPSRLPARQPAGNRDEELPMRQDPSRNPSKDRLANQLKERAARMKQAEAASRSEQPRTAGQANATGQAHDITAEPAASAGVDEIGDFLSFADHDGSAARAGSAISDRPAGSQASQAEIITSARADREAQMGEEAWADIFRSADERRPMHWDPDDQIFRCPECLHEVTGPNYCNLCALPLRTPDGAFDEGDIEELRRIQQHRIDGRGWAADSDEDSYSVSRYDPSSPELQGPWLEDEEEDESADDEEALPDEHPPYGYPSYVFDDEDDGSDLDDFIVDEYGDGLDDDDDNDDEEGDDEDDLGAAPWHPSINDDGDGVDDDDEEEEEDDRQHAAAGVQRLSRYRRSLPDNSEDEDEDEAPFMSRGPARYTNLLPLDDDDDDDDDDEDEPRQWAADHTYDGQDDGEADLDAGDEGDNDAQAYLYPDYQNSDSSDLTPPPGGDFEGDADDQGSIEGFGHLETLGAAHRRDLALSAPGRVANQFGYSEESLDETAGGLYGYGEDDAEGDEYGNSPEAPSGLHTDHPFLDESIQGRSSLLAARSAAYADGGVDGGMEFDRVNNINPSTLFDGADEPPYDGGYYEHDPEPVLDEEGWHAQEDEVYGDDEDEFGYAGGYDDGAYFQAGVEDESYGDEPGAHEPDAQFGDPYEHDGQADYGDGGYEDQYDGQNDVQYDDQDDQSGGSFDDDQY